MERIISLCLVFILLFSLFSCKEVEPRDISCEEIIAAYEEAGYTLRSHGHMDPTYTVDNIECSMSFAAGLDREYSIVFIDKYFTEEDAKAADEEYSFNIVLMIIFTMFGETRWLYSECYGDIHYSSLDSSMMIPMRKLTKG